MPERARMLEEIRQQPATLERALRLESRAVKRRLPEWAAKGLDLEAEIAARADRHAGGVVPGLPAHPCRRVRAPEEPTRGSAGRPGGVPHKN